MLAEYTGLVWMDYNPNVRVAIVVQDPSMPYQLADMISHVEIVAEGVQRVMIYEGDYFAHDMRRRRFQWRSAWGDRPRASSGA